MLYRLQSLIEAVQKNNFVNLPEDHLARRLHYDRNMHPVFGEPKIRFDSKFPHLDENQTYRLEGVHARDGKVMTKEVMQHFPELRQNQARYSDIFEPNVVFMSIVAIP